MNLQQSNEVLSNLSTRILQGYGNKKVVIVYGDIKFEDKADKLLDIMAPSMLNSYELEFSHQNGKVTWFIAHKLGKMEIDRIKEAQQVVIQELERCI